MNVVLIRKLGGSLIYLAYFIGMLSTGVCTPRHWQTSGRLVQELNVCTLQSSVYDYSMFVWLWMLLVYEPYHYVWYYDQHIQWYM